MLDKYLFVSDFLIYAKIIEENKELMYYDDYAHCIFVTVNGIDGFVINSEGFSYARYVAFFSKK